jgi:hypothetical protein
MPAGQVEVLKHRPVEDFRANNKIEKETFAYSAKESTRLKKRTVYEFKPGYRNKNPRPHRQPPAIKRNGASWCYLGGSFFEVGMRVERVAGWADAARPGRLPTWMSET